MATGQSAAAAAGPHARTPHSHARPLAARSRDHLVSVDRNKWPRRRVRRVQPDAIWRRTPTQGRRCRRLVAGQRAAGRPCWEDATRPATGAIKLVIGGGGGCGKPRANRETASRDPSPTTSDDVSRKFYSTAPAAAAAVTTNILLLPLPASAATGFPSLPSCRQRIH